MKNTSFGEDICIHIFTVSSAAAVVGMVAVAGFIPYAVTLPAR